MRTLKRIAIVTLIVVGIFTAFAAAITFPITLWWAFDVWEDRSHAITVLADTPMFAGTGDANCEGTQVAMISPGSKLKVRRIRYWKNCATIEVALPDGGVGYIGFDSRNVSVTPSLP